MKPFRFKQFSVADAGCAHKVGTDGVLLGCWVRTLSKDCMMLDIGTGSGVIALILAQRTSPHVHIDALEIEVGDAQQAEYNVNQSPWPTKVTVWHTPAQQYAPPHRYDLIVSNPPYFESSLLPPDRRRTQARHSELLPFNDLIETANRLLAPEGRLALVLPLVEGNRFIELALSAGLYLTRKTTFQSRKHKPVERLLMEFSRQSGTLEESAITLYEQGDTWSEGYRALTHDFYLDR